MANWYVSSVAYAAVETWSTLQGVLGSESSNTTLGQIITQTSPAVGSERCFRCTTVGTLGTAEPTWVLTHNATTNESGHGGTAVWTECTGQEAYQHIGSTSTWTAPSARNENLFSGQLNVVSAGDTVFYSSDHSQTQSTALTVSFLGTVAAPCFFISVDRTATVPPASTNYAAGATIATTGASSITLESGTSHPMYVYGLTFSAGNSTNTANILLTGIDALWSSKWDTCTFNINNSSASSKIELAFNMSLTNCTMNFGSTSQSIVGNATTGFVWGNSHGVAALTGSTPTTLISAYTAPSSITLRGLDLSAVTGTFIVRTTGFGGALRVANCKLGSGVTLPQPGDVFGGGSTVGCGPEQIIEFINCSLGGSDNYTHTWIRISGNVTTNTTYVRSGGATDGTQAVSHAMTTDNAVRCSVVLPLYHDIFLWNTKTGTSQTATVELLYAGTLTNAQVWGELEYLGDSTPSCISSFKSTQNKVPDTPSNLTTSAASWSGSLGSGVAQNLAITFTAQVVGLLRFRVNMAVVNKTMYVDPVITLS